MANPEVAAREQAARFLEESDDYRVLRRMPPPEQLTFADRGNGYDLGGIYLDVETTGLLPSEDTVIELAMVPFTFRTNEGVARITSVQAGVSWLNDPRRPIPPEITKITGITDEMVKGQRIDDVHVEALLSGASLVLAHNARFDRPFAERLTRTFETLPWGCTIEDGPWEALGIRYANLPHLLAERRGEFFDGHRGLVDCHAGLRVLMGENGNGGEYEIVDRAFHDLLASVRAGRRRVWAHGAPRSINDRLRARKYRWDGDGRRAWYRSCRTLAEASAEMDWLLEQYPEADFMAAVEKVSAYNRFTERA